MTQEKVTTVSPKLAQLQAMEARTPVLDFTSDPEALKSLVFHGPRDYTLIVSISSSTKNLPCPMCAYVRLALADRTPEMAIFPSDSPSNICFASFSQAFRPRLRICGSRSFHPEKQVRSPILCEDRRRASPKRAIYHFADQSDRSALRLQAQPSQSQGGQVQLRRQICLLPTSTRRCWFGGLGELSDRCSRTFCLQ